MGEPLSKLTLEGFKSIKALDGFELGPLTVLIGANGAGKSNFVDFFRLLRAMANEGLQNFVTQHGGASRFFHLGLKHTPQILARLEFDEDIYEVELAATVDDQMMIAEERIPKSGGRSFPDPLVRGGNLESQLLMQLKPGLGGFWKEAASRMFRLVVARSVYHFHDTSLLAPMRGYQSVRDDGTLREDASNIAALLLSLRETDPNIYGLICDTVRQVAPFFDDFILEPDMKGEEEKVRLEWRQKGSDYPFQAYQLSDGTIRFICLATALLQPLPPSTIVIDEPELGLHPFAISLLASLIQSASERTQVIVSTQSVTLVDQFKPEEIVVVDRAQGHSTFVRLDAAALGEWLDNYSVGELWQKNVLRGGPAND